jgi:hypothetical protein
MHTTLAARVLNVPASRDSHDATATTHLPWLGVLVLCACCLAFTRSFVASVSAQNQPIYPAYDGYVKTPDGTLILSFAYFSHNPKPVTIPPGSANLFAPDPADRLQPTTFYPGHKRFQCIMVVDAGFEGKLRWTLSYAGKSVSTSEEMLQYSWELEEGSQRQVLRGIDLKTAPRGICLNRPPLVRVLGLRASPTQTGGQLTVTLPNELNLFGSVEDEGLPRPGTLAVGWRKTSGPGNVTFEAPNASRTRASFTMPGTYELELWASDSLLESRAQVRVRVDPRQ